MSRRTWFGGSTMLALSLAALPPAFAQQAELEARANLAMNLTRSQISRVDVVGSAGEPLVALLEIYGRPVLLQMAPHSVRAAGFQLLEQREDGRLVAIDPGPVTTYRGDFVGLPGSRVAASLMEDGLYARCCLPNGEEYWLEPLARRVAGAGAAEHVLYRREDVICAAMTCGADLLPDNLPKLAGGSRSGPPEMGSLGIQVAELACDGTYEFYQHWGSSLAGSNRIQSVIGAMNPQFETEVGISHEITTIVVRTSTSQPYTTIDPFVLFDQFSAEWRQNQTGIARDVAQLFSGPLPGSTIAGIAAIGTVCNAGQAFSFVQGFDLYGNFLCSTNLSAHELGHNWNATHCDCPNSTMNPTLNCTNTFDPILSRPEIITYRDSVSCLGSAGGGVPTVRLLSESFDNGSLSSRGWSAQNGDASLSRGSERTGTYGARLKKTTWIERTVNTTGFSVIRLEYSRRTDGLDANESLFVEWWNGSAWQLVESTSSTAWADQAFVLDASAGNNPAFRIRFRTNANQNNERGDVDDVRVIGSS